MNKNTFMKKNRHSVSTPLAAAAFGILLLCICTLLLLSYFPTSSCVEKSVTIVEGRHYYQLEADGTPLLYFSNITADSVMADLSLTPDSVQTFSSRDTACWVNLFPVVPSCRGLLLTKDNIGNISENEIPVILSRQRHRIDSLLCVMADTEDDLADYLAIHRVTEQGYNMIADFTQQHRRKIYVHERARTILDSLRDNARLCLARVSTYYIHTNTPNGQTQASPCRLLREDNGYLQLLAPDSLMPKDARAVFHRAAKARHLAGQPVREKEPARKPVDKGHGTWVFPDGTYYEGNWEGGKRNGFGFAITEGRLRAGEWKDDKFKGERLAHSDERIYGIDISRYQHEEGRKRFSINWNKLRISHLGHVSSKSIVGKVDYPVSFLFIKTSQGITISNRYYAQDYKAARKKGIRVGSYHFFSVKAGGAQQAAYFLKNASFSTGDLPPVLDVEPSDRQIEQMGGIQAMFREIRAFCKVVENKVGVRPILYVNQRFVNNYLPAAPDIKRDYLLWIARYGEYKPDVRLSFWQLTSYGRVTGIHGHVDINVFNGYDDKFRSFLQNNCIR